MKKINNFYIIISIVVIILLIYQTYKSVPQTMLGSVDKTITRMLDNTDNYFTIEDIAIPSSPDSIRYYDKCINNKLYIDEIIPFKPYSDNNILTIAKIENYYDEGWKQKGDMWVLNVNYNNKKFYGYEGYVNNIKINNFSGYCYDINLLKRNSDEIISNPNNFRDDKSKYVYYKIKLVCRVSGWVPCKALQINDNQISIPSTIGIKVKIPKNNNINCLDDSWCNDYMECINNECIIKNKQTSLNTNNNYTSSNKFKLNNNYIPSRNDKHKLYIVYAFIFVVLIILLFIIYNLNKNIKSKK